MLLACIGVALMLGAVARSSAGSGPSFAQAKSYATAAGPAMVAAGDLNGDGRPDLVTASHSDWDIDEGCPTHVVSVLLNRGDGTLARKHDYPASGCPLAVAIADMNSDGRPDVVSANWSDWDDPDAGPSTVSVLLNVGDGTFEPERAYPTGRGAASVAIADLNGDGALDVATGSSAAPSGSLGCALVATVSVLLNRGDGTLAPQHSYPTGRCPTIAIGDLDGDGKPELVAANDGSNSVSVLRNQGDGTFAPRRDFRAEEPSSLAVGDLNGDSRPDIATTNGGLDRTSGINVFFNRGSAGFRHRSYPAGLDEEGDTEDPLALVIADVNGDRRPDLAYLNLADSVSVLLNRGRGSFLPRLSYQAVPPPARQWYWDPTSLAVSDLNGDGRPDLTVANEDSSHLSVFLNTPGLCNVQYVGRMTLAAARRKLARINCRVGNVKRVPSKIKAGRVISQRPSFGAVRPGGAKVNLVVSLGRKR